MDNNSVDSKKEEQKTEPSKQDSAAESMPNEMSSNQVSSNKASSNQEDAVKGNTQNSEQELVTANTSEKSTSEDQPSENKSSKNKPATDKSSKGSAFVKVVLVLILLLLLVIVGGGGWWFYQLQQQQPMVNAVQQEMESQQQDIDRLQQQLNADRTERQDQQESQAALQLTLNQSINDLQLKMNSQARRLRELSTTTRSDWLLAEAEYLIRLANQRLITERNTKNATSLLLTADGILRDLDEVDLLPVRQSLAKSITALRSVPMVDRDGLYIQLGALSDALVTLPLLAPELDDDSVSENEVADEPTERLAEVDEKDARTEGWSDKWKQTIYQSFDAALAATSDLIRVRRRDAPLDALPSEQEDQKLRHNLAILLEQAQLALLREEQGIYQASLEKTQAWLKGYFELNTAAEPLMEQLALLKQENIVQELPDISEGLEVLRDFIDSWHKRHVVDKNQVADKSSAVKKHTVEQSGEDQPGEQ